MTSRPTIFALSSGLPPAAIAIIRLSGPEVAAVLCQLTQRPLPEARYAVIRQLYAPASRELLDEALTLWLPGPATVTGEDVVELHVHGGRAVVHDLLAALATIPGLQPAQPGAFTRRAFDNGRMDLSQVEGVADLIAAETEGQRRNALALSQGEIARKVKSWRASLLRLSAQVEAQLDFADEDDAAGGIDASAVRALAHDLAQWLEAPAVERLRDGVRVVIAGPPNAGKSTLLNVLAGRPVAITAPIAGTTRDIVEANVSIDGIPFVLTDTAGLHEDSVDPIEREGMRRAQAAIDAADIVLWLGERGAVPSDRRIVYIAARADERADQAMPNSDAEITLSAVAGTGMRALRSLLLSRAHAMLPSAGAIAISARQRGGITRILSEVRSIQCNHDPLIQAEHLRLALVAVDQLAGRAGIEDVLDTLFGSMCIGK